MRRLTRLPRPATQIFLALVHIAAIGVVGVADFQSGPDFDLRPLYLFPVVSAAWFGGRTIGLVISVAATLSLFFANDYLGTATSRGLFVPLWLTVSRLTIYTVVALLTSMVRGQRDDLRAQSEELRQEGELREEYISLFVHELRHSAASMSLVSASLVSSPRLADDERSFLGRLRQQAADLEQLAGGLLAIGRIESGALALNLVSIDLGDVAVGTATESYAPHRVKVRGLGKPAHVLADPEELRRALDNYLRNALKYSPPDSLVALEVVERAGEFGIEVSDVGIGFDPKDRPRLFRKYGRLASPGSEGAGLGLYLARLIAEAHGGRVEAASAGLGSGSRFGLFLSKRRGGDQ